MQAGGVSMCVRCPLPTIVMCLRLCGKGLNTKGAMSDAVSSEVQGTNEGKCIVLYVRCYGLVGLRL